MKESKRSIRRHHRERLKNKRKHYWGYMDRYFNHISLPDDFLGKVVDTPTPCSCCMCGNPRKYQKKRLTIQELKQEQIDKWDKTTYYD